MGDKVYFNAESHYHPSDKQVVHRATALCDEVSLQAELVFLRTSSTRMATTGRSTEPSTAILI
jgi:hypothetical protein